jgi:ribonuclease-3
VSGGAKHDPRAQAIAELETRLGYVFKDRALLDRALTHASVSGLSKNVQQNETLEFLGDRVLGLLTAERLMQLHPEEREGALSTRLHGIVNREACARVGREVGLPEAIRRAGISTRKQTAAADTVIADACEALLGAIYLDGGIDEVRGVYLRIWAAEIEAAPVAHSNPKNELQELMLKRGLPVPRYRIVEQTGPAHAPVFTVEVEAQGAEPARAVGRSRQDAEKAAAKSMLEQEAGR